MIDLSHPIRKFNLCEFTILFSIFHKYLLTFYHILQKRRPENVYVTNSFTLPLVYILIVHLWLTPSPMACVRLLWMAPNQHKHECTFCKYFYLKN